MSRKAKSREELEGKIGYVFADKAILERALTHVSAASPKQGRGGSYQRLEFLGDHVLGLAVSDMLYRAFPRGDEGELSRRLADLVRRETCADVARAIDLGAELRLGNSESKCRFLFYSYHLQTRAPAFRSPARSPRPRRNRIFEVTHQKLLFLQWFLVDAQGIEPWTSPV